MSKRGVVEEELHAVALANTIGEIEALDVPALRAMANKVIGRDDASAILDLIGHASERLADGRMQHAADVLFGERRWDTGSLGARQEAAGEHFGVHSQSGWTRPRRDGRPSYHDQLLRELGMALAQLKPSATSNPSAVGKRGVPPVGTARLPRRPVRRARLLVGAVAAIVMAAAGGIAVSQLGSGDETLVSGPTTLVDSRPQPACAIGAGQPSQDLAVPDVERLDVSRELWVELAGDACGFSGVRRFGTALAQDLAVGTRNAGAIVMARGNEPVRLTRSQWVSYLEMAGRNSPDNSRELGGYPVAVFTDGSASYVELTGGGVLVGHIPEGLHFWIPTVGEARQRWEALGGAGGELGRPMSNPILPLAPSDWYQRAWYLEFEFGYMTAPPSIDPDSVMIEFVDDRLAPLDGVGEFAGTVVTQVGSQAWFIDDELIAHWIPDLDTWDCIGAVDMVIAEGVPGWTVASFEPGQNADCT